MKRTESGRKEFWAIRRVYSGPDQDIYKSNSELLWLERHNLARWNAKKPRWTWGWGDDTVEFASEADARRRLRVAIVKDQIRHCGWMSDTGDPHMRIEVVKVVRYAVEEVSLVLTLPEREGAVDRLAEVAERSDSCCST